MLRASKPACFVSWMLTGREEPNPVGYLWIEFARINADGELDHFVCGWHPGQRVD